MPYRTTEKMKARKAKRRRRFLDVATRLFGADGYHATTVPSIVEASGSSTGSFYFYFDNKEELFAKVLEDIGERLSAALDEAMEGIGEPRERMRAAVVGLFTFLATHPAEGRILLLETSGIGGEPEEARRRIVESHTRSVRTALESLDRVAGDPEILARCWIGAVHEAVRGWLAVPPSRRAPAEDVASEVALFNLRGIDA